jgi:hypothetical protein
MMMSKGGANRDQEKSNRSSNLNMICEINDALQQENDTD